MSSLFVMRRPAMPPFIAFMVFVLALLFLCNCASYSQNQQAAIDFQLPNLSALSGPERLAKLNELAFRIQAFPASGTKVVLAEELAESATDGASTDSALQTITTTLSEALQETSGRFAPAYLKLAELIRYEGMHTTLNNPQLASALEKLGTDDRDFQQLNFNLPDLHGKRWRRKDLIGRIVLVDFWSTGCSPCVNEIPALNALYKRFHKQGLEILAISDDDLNLLLRFVAKHQVLYTVLSDPGSQIMDRFHIVSIPRVVLYKRSGIVVAQTMAFGSEKKLVRFVARAGLH